MTPRSQQRGFTLLEVLVASVITAIALTLGYGAINQVLLNRDRVHAAQQRIDDLQRTMRLLVGDFSQADNRAVRDVLGRGREAAFRADPRGTTLVSLTRGGRASFAADVRGSLERVDYALEGDKLVRIAWPVLDRTQGTRPRRRVLVTGVRAVSLRFLGTDRVWVTQWPRADEARLGTRPVAVEITIETDDFGKLLRLVEVPG